MIKITLNTFNIPPTHHFYTYHVILITLYTQIRIVKSKYMIGQMTNTMDVS